MAFQSRDGVCSEMDCETPIQSRGLCNKHYIQVWRVTQVCPVENCTSKKHKSGLCKKHNNEFNGHHSFVEPTEGSPEAKAYYAGLWEFVQKELGLVTR